MGIFGRGKEVVNLTVSGVRKATEFALKPVVIPLKKLRSENDYVGSHDQVHQLYKKATRPNIHAANDMSTLRGIIGSNEEGKITPRQFLDMMSNEYHEDPQVVARRMGWRLR